MRGTLRPDELIGRHRMQRWWVLPPTSWFAIYVHKTIVDDERLLHDHPQANISIRLKGELYEERPALLTADGMEIWRKTRHLVWPWKAVSDVPHRGSEYFIRYSEDDSGQMTPRVTLHRLGRVLRRRPFDVHRLIVRDGPCWTIWIRWGRRHQWGFYTPLHGWVPWRKGLAYMDAEDQQAVLAARRAAVEPQA